MSHDLEQTNGTTFFADSRADAWHQLGQQVGHCMTAEEVMAESQLANWNVRKHRIWTEGSDGFPLQIDDRMATVRTNPITGNTDYLGVVGKTYQPIQNEESAAFMNALVDESGAHFETAGSLSEGRATFVTMRLPEYMEFRAPETGAADTTDLYIAALNRHDGMGSFRIIISPVRIVCANTQAMAESMAVSSWAVRHTSNALANIEDARQSVKVAFRYADVFADEMQKLIQREIDNEEARRLLDSVFQVEDSETERQKNLRSAHVDAVLGGLLLPTVAGFEKTRYGLYNAVTEYIDHRIEVRKGTFGAPASAVLSTDSSYTATKARAFSVLAGTNS